MKKIGSVKTNVYVVSIIAALIALGCYLLMFKLFDTQIPLWVKGIKALFVFIYVIAIVLMHELIHMITAYLFVPFKSVHLKIKILTWEVSSERPFRRNQFFIYVLTPGCILSIVGMLLFFSFNSIDIKYFSALLFLIGFAGATGDAWLALGAFRAPRNSYILDKGNELDILI